MTSPHRLPGVTVAVCCYNSASRLPETLSHLIAQRNPRAIPWEVVLVDNASTDDTAEVAARLWPADAPAPLRVVRENRPGLQWARERARLDARHEILCLVDDDNWVAPDWIDAAECSLAARPGVAACGGPSEAVCEAPPPSWFPKYAGFYAVGHQFAADPAAVEPRVTLWGAGLTLRLSAWDDIIRQGFQSLVSDRKGASLSSGGDNELCLALRLAGWRCYYDPRLRLKHFVPAGRLTWNYVRRLSRGFGASLLDPYWFALGEGLGACPRFKQAWAWVFARQIWYTARARLACARNSHDASAEGHPLGLRYESAVGRLQALWQDRAEFSGKAETLRRAPWRRPMVPVADAPP